MQMVASDNHDGLVDDPIEDAVGETGNKRPSCLSVNDCVGHGRADNIPDCHAHSAEELLTEARSLLFVPPIGLPEVRYGGCAKEELPHRDFDRMS